MRILLLALCIWPFCHGESHKVTLDAKGSAIIPLRKVRAESACVFTNAATHGFELRPGGKQFVHVQGKPGDVVSVACK